MAYRNMSTYHAWHVDNLNSVRSFHNNATALTLAELGLPSFVH